MKPSTIYVADNYLLTRLLYEKCFEFEKDYLIKADFANSIDFLNKIENSPCDIALIDYELKDMQIQNLVGLLNQKYPEIKIILTCGLNSVSKLCELNQLNIRAYVLKKNCVQNLKNIINAVACGAFWLDFEIAKATFEKMEKNNNVSRNLEFENVVNTLTKRELEVLKLMTEGKTNSQIAHEIIVSINTAKAHVGNILVKLSARDRVQAVVKAVRANIV